MRSKIATLKKVTIDDAAKGDCKIYNPSKKIIVTWFNILNYVIFEDKLTIFDNIYIRRLRGQHAYVQYENADASIDLHCNKYFKSKKEFVTTIAHEMVHVHQIRTYGRAPHSRTFYEWREKFEKYNISLGIKV